MWQSGPIQISAPIDYDQLYAQAIHAINSGERYWLNSDEEERLTGNNSGFQQESLEIQYLFTYFRLPEADEAGERYTAVELLDIISERSHRTFSNTSSNNFARMLKASGVKRVHTKNGNCYYLVAK